MKKLILAVCLTLTGCAAPQYSTDQYIQRNKELSFDELPEEAQKQIVCYRDQIKIRKNLKASYSKELDELGTILGPTATEAEINAALVELDKKYLRWFIIDNIDDISFEGLNPVDAEMCRQVLAFQRDYIK